MDEELMVDSESGLRDGELMDGELMVDSESGLRVGGHHQLSTPQLSTTVPLSTIFWESAGPAGILVRSANGEVRMAKCEWRSANGEVRIRHSEFARRSSNAALNL
jgi:hypothetical protein